MKYVSMTSRTEKRESTPVIIGTEILNVEIALTNNSQSNNSEILFSSARFLK